MFWVTCINNLSLHHGVFELVPSCAWHEWEKYRGTEHYSVPQLWYLCVLFKIFIVEFFVPDWFLYYKQVVKRTMKITQTGL